MKTIRSVENAPKPVGPYSPAVVSGNVVYCSGQIGLDPETGEMAEGLEAQTSRVLENLKAVLETSGSSVDNIIMSSIFLASMSDFKTVNGIYADFVDSENPPARQTVAVKELPLGALIEISVIAELK